MGLSSKTPTRRTRRGAAALIAVLFAIVFGVFACTSPTLPLPPPTLPTITTGTEPGTFRLKSDKGALPNALVVVVNRNDSLPRDQRVEGTIADVEGSWELTIKANVGDFVDISQDDGNTRSPITTAQLK